MDESPTITVAGLLIGIGGFCLALAAIPAAIAMMGGLPDPGRQSDFFIEIVIWQVFVVCCVVGLIVLVTVVAIAYASK